MAVEAPVVSTPAVLVITSPHRRILTPSLRSPALGGESTSDADWREWDCGNCGERSAAFFCHACGTKRAQGTIWRPVAEGLIAPTSFFSPARVSSAMSNQSTTAGGPRSTPHRNDNSLTPSRRSRRLGAPWEALLGDAVATPSQTAVSVEADPLVSATRAVEVHSSGTAAAASSPLRQQTSVERKRSPVAARAGAGSVPRASSRRSSVTSATSGSGAYVDLLSKWFPNNSLQPTSPTRTGASRHVDSDLGGQTGGLGDFSHVAHRRDIL